MCSLLHRRGRMLREIMKSFHHRAFYCYIAMSIWIFFLISAMYKYISVEEQIVVTKKIPQNEHITLSDVKYRRIYLKSCNPAETIERGSEGLVDEDSWVLQGVLVVTRHGDRGPLTHLKGGDRLPCDTIPVSPLYQSYVSWVHAMSAGTRGPWSVPGPFHNFPALPPAAPGAITHCPLGQLTPQGLLQMIRVGKILQEAYVEKLGLNQPQLVNSKKDAGAFILYSTRYRRTYQSLLGVVWALSGSGGALNGNGGALNGNGGALNGTRAARRVGRTRESASIAFCFRDCVCAAQPHIQKKIDAQANKRFKTHPAIVELVRKISSALFLSEDKPNPETVREGLLAYLCHDIPLPCTDKRKSTRNKRSTHKNFNRKLTQAEDVMMDDYIDFNRKDKVYDSKKTPLDFDAQMEKEKFQYYQQKYLDNSEYQDVVVVKKSLDADFNFPNDARMDTDFDDENYKDVTEKSDDFCVQRDHMMSLFAFIEWGYKQQIKNLYNRKRGLLVAYGLMHNIVQNMIRMISENKPKFVLYSGHDRTLQALILALGLTDYQHFNIKYASRMIFEVYRKKDLVDEFMFNSRKAVAQDYYFRVVYNGVDVTNKLSFCNPKSNVDMEVSDPFDDMRIHKTHLCPIENIVRFIHDDYFSLFNVTNYKDACSSFGSSKVRF